MREKKYLLDTHALIFWVERQEISSEFVEFLDMQAEKGKVFLSSVSIWEIALLKKKGRIEIEDVHRWKDDVISHSQAKILDPTTDDMIDSTLLSGFHQDPFDRLFIAQAVNNHAILVTRDRNISRYPVETFWM